MKSKILISIIALGIAYVIYSFSGPGGSIGNVKKEILGHAAKWFESKGVTKIVSTEFFANKHEEVFNSYEIEIYTEEIPQSKPVEQIEEQRPEDEFSEKIPVNENLIDLEFSFNIANKSKSKGIYVKGDFAANGKNLELMKEFVANKGFIYFSSPSHFYNLSQEFITFIKESVTSNNITIMDFEKMNHQSGSTMASNLRYLFHYDSSNAKQLIDKLTKRLENDLKIKSELNKSPY